MEKVSQPSAFELTNCPIDLPKNWFGNLLHLFSLNAPFKFVLTLTLQTSDRNNAVAIFDRATSLFQTDYSTFLKKDFHQPSAEPLPGGSTLLLPMVKCALERVSATTADLGLIAVTQGPGMFTPLRVGVVAAKTMAYVNSIPLVGVDVLESLALAAARRQKLTAGKIVQTVVNAQRQQLFAGKFIVNDAGRVDRCGENALVNGDAWAESIGENVLLTGPGLKILSESTLYQLSGNATIDLESPRWWHCDISTVADIALNRFDNGDLDDPWSLDPIYFRPSAAEERRTNN